MTSRCQDCGAEFRTDKDALLCPRCQRIDDAIFANDPTPVAEWEYEHPPKWSKAWMRERLGISGDVDE